MTMEASSVRLLHSKIWLFLTRREPTE